MPATARLCALWVLTRVCARCCFEIFKSLTFEKFLYDVVTAKPHFFVKQHCPRSAATILDGLAEVDKSQFNRDGSFNEAMRESCHTLCKTLREAHFPDALCNIALDVAVERGEASVPSDRKHILRTIAGLPAPSHRANEPCNCEEPPATHPRYDEVSRALRGRFAASALPRAVEAGGERLGCYLKALEGAHKVLPLDQFGSPIFWAYPSAAYPSAKSRKHSGGLSARAIPSCSHAMRIDAHAHTRAHAYLWICVTST